MVTYKPILQHAYWMLLRHQLAPRNFEDSAALQVV